jgi:hypothetical protein
MVVFGPLWTTSTAAGTSPSVVSALCVDLASGHRNTSDKAPGSRPAASVRNYCTGAYRNFVIAYFSINACE